MPGSSHWISTLHNKNPDVRIEAIEQAARLPDAQGVPLLVDMLGDMEWRVRKAAANRLKRRQPSPFLLDRLLAAITTSDDPWRRMAAIDVTVSLGADDETGGLVTTSLLDALATTGIEERKFVVEVLGLMGAGGAVRPLIEQLSVDDDNLQISTLDALAKIGDRRALPAILKRLSAGAASVRFAALTTLQHLGDPSAETAALQAMKDPALRLEAIEVLGHIGGGQAVPSMWEWWMTGTEEERTRALAALDRIMRRMAQRQRDEWAVELRRRYRPLHQADLLTKMEASDPIIQRAAISLAGWVREPAAVMPLMNLLAGGLAAEAKQALSMMAIDHVDRLLELLPRSTPTIYSALIELLAGTADPKVLSVMKEALSSMDARVRRAAALGIAAQNDRDSAPALVGLLLDRDPEVQEAAVWALERCQNETAVAAVIALLGDESPAIRALAARTLGLIRPAEGQEPLARALRDPDAAVRAAAVVSLHRLGERWGVTTLKDHFLLALGDEAPSVRLEAARALQRREATLPVHWWRCLADDPDQWVRAVAARSAATGGKAHAALLHQYLRDESGAVRIAALEGVAEHPEAGDPAAVREALRNEDPDVVTAALAALAAMTARQPARGSESPAKSNDRSTHLVEDVLPMLVHPVWTVRAAGMRVLALIDPERARRHVKQLASDDPHPTVREEASRLLSARRTRRNHPQSARSKRS